MFRVRLIIATAMMAFAIVMLMSAAEADAQCPTGWTASSIVIPVNFPGPPICASNVTINYCTPPSGSTPAEYYWISSVTLSPMCGTTITPAMMRKIARALAEANPANYNCPPCPELSPEWSLSWGSCARQVTNPDGSVSLITCNDNVDARCIDKYNVCCDVQGVKHATLVASLPGPGCDVPPPPGCTNMCPSGL